MKDDFSMHINKNLAISESGFVFNPGSGDSFSTNQVGRDILKKLQSETDNENLIEFITTTYAVDRSIAEKDLHDFILMLETYEIAVRS